MPGSGELVDSLLGALFERRGWLTTIGQPAEHRRAVGLPGCCCENANSFNLLTLFLARCWRLRLCPVMLASTWSKALWPFISLLRLLFWRYLCSFTGTAAGLQDLFADHRNHEMVCAARASEQWSSICHLIARLPDAYYKGLAYSFSTRQLWRPAFVFKSLTCQTAR